MKVMKKAFLLFGTALLSLCSCNLEKRCECLESSDSLTYHEGQCYQVNRANVVESLFLINNPINPEEEPERYKYDITWSETVRLENFSCVDGLSGKHIMSIFRINDRIIKVTVDGVVTDKEATSGYIRILPTAFTAHTERATDSVIYAYVAIGDNSALIVKP